MSTTLLQRLIITVGCISVLAPSLAAASTNDMLSGGCATAAICSTKIAADPGVQHLYAAHSVSASTLAQTVPGEVTKSGEVIVNGQVVATAAQSYGRDDLAGSTKVDGFFRRPTSVSFVPSQLSGFMYLVNGRFKYAILSSCGNLVIATPKVIAPTPKPVVPATTVTTPAPTINVIQIQEQHQTVVTAATPPTPVIPAPQPTPAPAPVVHPTPLPSTGASATAGMLGLSALLTTGWYYVRSRRDVQLALLRLVPAKS